MLTITSKLQLDNYRKQANLLELEQHCNANYLDTATERLAGMVSSAEADINAENKLRDKDDKIDKTEALNYFKETDETYLALEAYSTALETRNASIDSEMKFLNEAIDAFQKEHENGIKDDTNFWCFGGG